MKLLHLLLPLFFLSATWSAKAQPVITVKKTCECTYEGNISSSIRASDSKLYEGKKYKATVRVENTGTCTWGSREVELRAKILRCPSGSACNRPELIPSNAMLTDRDIIRGYTFEFDYDFTCPTWIGKFTIQFQLYYQNKPFGDPIPFYIEVLDDPRK